jgi:hypothetical protein
LQNDFLIRLLKILRIRYSDFGFEKQLRAPNGKSIAPPEMFHRADNNFGIDSLKQILEAEAS